MTVSSLTKVLSVEYLLGLIIALIAAYAAFSAWQADANAKLIYLEQRAIISQLDHDALIALTADVRFIKENVAEIKRAILPKKEASNADGP